MPRAPRLQFDGAFYHAYHRGNRREPIFLDDYDYAHFETLLLEAMNWSGVKLFGWKLMPNHFHLLVETPDGNLAEFMQRLLTRYAKYFNARHHQVGHVFQGRYGAKVCDKEAYFKELIRYIQLNAYRTEGQPLAPVGQWKWSSHRYLMMPESQWPEGIQTAFREVLEHFAEDPIQARQAYSKFLTDGLESGSWKDFYQPKAERFLGSDTFVEKIKVKTGEIIRAMPRDLKPMKTAGVLAEVVSQLSGMSRDALSNRSQKEVLNRWRQAFVYVGRRMYRLRIKDLAGAIGREASVASHMLRRMGSEETLPEIQRLLEALKR